jgi:hypothetical protein
LCTLTSDPEDLNALTPAHFLIGESSDIILDTESVQTPTDHLNWFQLMQRIRNQFWRKWSSEYLHHLQEHGKWPVTTNNVRVGQTVLLRDDCCPPAKWPLGRIVEVYAGRVGLVRVVTVKTATNTFRRYVARVCILSLEEPKASGPT